MMCTLTNIIRIRFRFRKQLKKIRFITHYVQIISVIFITVFNSMNNVPPTEVNHF